MQVIGATARQVQAVVDEVSNRLYGGNVIVKSLTDRSNRRGGRARFTIRVLDSHAGRPGAVGNPTRNGGGPHGYGRRISACWHAHWDVIEELLRRHPDARVRSGGLPTRKALVYTAATFRERALETAHLPVGDQGSDVTPPQCCECDHTRYTDVPPVARPEPSGAWMTAQDVPGSPAGRGTSDEPDWVHGPDYVVYGRPGGPVEPHDEVNPGWARRYEAGRVDTSVPYLGGLAPAAPYVRPRRGSGDVIDRIDRELEQGIG